MIDWVIERCHQLTTGEAEVATGGIPGLPPGQIQVNISEVFLQVWTANEAAIKFYKKLGFEQGETIKDYYRDLTPSDCVVFRKPIAK